MTQMASGPYSRGKTRTANDTGPKNGSWISGIAAAHPTLDVHRRVTVRDHAAVASFHLAP
jgi:hypothetical protein